MRYLKSDMNDPSAATSRWGGTGASIANTASTRHPDGVKANKRPDVSSRQPRLTFFLMLPFGFILMEAL
jgi:hypothetical protein